MNKKTRKELESLISRLEEIGNRLQELSEEEEEKLYNLPESLQESERGQQFQEVADALSTSAESVEEAINALMEIE